MSTTTAFDDPKIRQRVISDLEKTIAQSERELAVAERKRQKLMNDIVKNGYTQNDDNDKNDPERELLLQQEIENIRLKNNNNSSTNKKNNSKKNNNPISAFTSRVRSWKESSFLFKFINSLSGWFLIAFLLFLMSWARYSMEPISHLVGYQLIVTDISVIDGDTFRGKVFPENIEAKFKLRLIDAPEMDQPFGFEASEILSEILTGDGNTKSTKHNNKVLPSSPKSREVIVSVIGLDERKQQHIGSSSSSTTNHNRKKNILMNHLLPSSSGSNKGGLIYYCDAVIRDSVFLNTTSVQKLMVERGAAWAMKGFHSTKRPSSLVLAMEEAKRQKIGLWKNEPLQDDENENEGQEMSSTIPKIMPPWEFAQMKKNMNHNKNNKNKNKKANKKSTNKKKVRR